MGNTMETTHDEVDYGKLYQPSKEVYVVKMAVRNYLTYRRLLLL